MKNDYKIKLVNEIDFRSLSLIDISKYKDSIVSQIPERIKNLENKIKSYPEFSNWTADFSIQSLNTIDEWMISYLEVVPFSEAEIQSIESSLAFAVDFDRWKFTDLSYSIIFDAAIYFATVFTHRYSNINWTIELTSKKFADYGQPVLSGFNTYLNPFRVLEVIAIRIYKGQKKEVGSLVSIFEIWKDKITTSTSQ